MHLDRRWCRALLVALGIASLGWVVGCGGGNEKTVVETLTRAAPSTDSASTITGSASTAEVPSTTSPNPDVSSGQVAEDQIKDTLRAFNRTANLGRLQRACNNYFSKAFLARLATERACATTLAGARGGKGKVEMQVVSVFPHDDGTAEATVRLGGGVQFEDYRLLALVSESGAWKIDAVNTIR